MARTGRGATWRNLRRIALSLFFAGLLSVQFGGHAQAQTVSSACAAVNGGAFNLTAVLSPANSAILTAWNVGDTITLTITSNDGIGRIDGLYHGSDFTVARFGSLSTVSVPTTGSVKLSYTVTANDLTNGIAVDPENNDSVTATCAPEPLPTVTVVSPASGPTTGGTSVTITGTNFGGARSVVFGGNGANFTVVNATTITATTPAHGAGAVEVDVTTGAGTGIGSAAFTYLVLPAVTGISPNKGPAAGGTIVTITGTGFSPATGVSFGGAAAVSFTVNTDSQITATSPPGSPGVVDVTVSTANGPSPTSAADRFTYLPPPPVIISISPSNGPTGGGTSVTIMGANFTGATAVSFGSTAAAFAVSSASQITATSPAGNAGTVDITVTTSGGTSAASAADQFTYGTFHTWVASTGNDSNDCSRPAPCKTFAAAITQTVPNGDISVIDAGDYGAAIITKSIGIYADQTGEAGTLAIGTNGITVSAGSADVIELVGLAFNGMSAADAIQINSAAKVNIENCVLQEFSAGIAVTPLSGAVKVDVSNTSIAGNGVGIDVKPAALATANVSIRDSRLNNNLGGGLRVDGGSGGTSNVTIADSSVSQNASNGIAAVSGPGNVSVDISGVVAASNGLRGIQANQGNGGMAVVTVGDSILSYNGAGAWANIGGATLLSFQNNQVTGPTGTPPSPASFQ
jgi:IPT/TIG domain/Right handed beta helix region